MRQTENLTCPYCNEVQNDDIYELTCGDDFEGDFTHICDGCDKEFEVEFEYRPFIKCYK